MALVRSALEVGPYAIGDDEEGEEHGDIPGTPSLATSDEAIDELQRLDHAHSASRLVQPPVSRTAPGQAISREMAYRAMRDAVALQLARRGFDGLRGTALWLVAELAADFTRALGYSGTRCSPPPPSARLTRTLTLTRTLNPIPVLPLALPLSLPLPLPLTRWAHMATIFSRSTNQEPLQGSVYAQVQG